MKRLVLFVAVALSLASVAGAQTITNPSTVQFTKSPDHDAIQFGNAVLSNYAVEFYAPGATVPVQTSNIGKPTPATDGTVTADLKAASRPITIAGTYTLKVIAVGPGGANGSAASVPFILGPTSPAAPVGTPVIKQ